MTRVAEAPAAKASGQPRDAGEECSFLSTERRPSGTLLLEGPVPALKRWAGQPCASGAVCFRRNLGTDGTFPPSKAKSGCSYARLLRWYCSGRRSSSAGATPVSRFRISTARAIPASEAFGRFASHSSCCK